MGSGVHFCRLCLTLDARPSWAGCLASEPQFPHGPVGTEPGPAWALGKVKFSSVCKSGTAGPDGTEACQSTPAAAMWALG